LEAQIRGRGTEIISDVSDVPFSFFVCGVGTCDILSRPFDGRSTSQGVLGAPADLAGNSAPELTPLETPQGLFPFLPENGNNRSTSSTDGNKEVQPPLNNVSRRGDWAGWLKYFLRAVARQFEDALSRARRINEQLGSWKHATAGSRTAQLAVERLGSNPFFTVLGMQRDLKTSYNTASRAIVILEKAGIARRVGDARRNRAYCAQAILDILEEPARLVPQEAA
jgi:hypothetical protein